MNRETFVIQGQPCYVRLMSCSDSQVNYLVGTYNSPESPVSVKLNGQDSFDLRMKAVEKGLSEILAGETYN